MADAAPTNGGDGNGGGQPNNGGGQPNTPVAGGDIDLSTLPADQLSKVLENPELFNLPRIKELRDQAALGKKLQEDAQKATEDKLKEDKKFEELVTSKEQENSSLKESMKAMQVDQALTSKLVPLGVVDLEAAIKLADRSKIKIGDDGTISGVEDVIKALQSDKAYLFGTPNQPKVGSPSNGNNAPSGPAKFKRSQLRDPAFYKENQKEILAAHKAGLIEDDIR